MNPIMAALVAFLFFIILGVQTVDAAQKIELYWSDDTGNYVVLSTQPCETPLTQDWARKLQDVKLFQAEAYEHYGTDKETVLYGCWFSPPVPDQVEGMLGKPFPVVNIFAEDGFAITVPLSKFMPRELEQKPKRETF
jgi:hypothetical protein